MKPLFLLSGKLPSAAEALFEQALTQAGWRHHDCEVATVAEANRGSYVGRFITAFGDTAARACLGDDWRSGWATERRGYLWEGIAGSKVLTTLDPRACLQTGYYAAGVYIPAPDPSGINGMLLVADLERGKREAKMASLSRAGRTITIVHTAAEAAVSATAIRAAGYTACDIECYDSETLQCIGFATSPHQAYVFVGQALDAALEIVADSAIHKVFQNGQFDAYFLATRCGVNVAGWTDDCMIAWHALWPEIAGKGAKGSKRTRKSLAFLASLYTESPEWWKEYGGDDASMYYLNGVDCCVTFEIMQALKKEIASEGVSAIYQHEMSMMPVLVAIQQRGLLIDEDTRGEAVATLAARAAEVTARIQQLAEPLLRERAASITKPHLFFGTKRCACCNGGAKKAAACWSCAGLAKAPGKRQAATLAPCVPCGGAGRFETFEFNPASSTQQVELFYNVLNLPRRYNDGVPTADEKALKSLLAELAG